jgi:ADP-ribosyl-[dinitrogen reductase] hydrolase
VSDAAQFTHGQPVHALGTAEWTARVMAGLAAGDRIGGPTQMARCLVKSLAECRGFDPEDVFSRYLEWWRVSGFDTGPVAARVFDRVAHGVPRERAVLDAHNELGGMTAGCNPAHRAAPLAACMEIPDDELDLVARAEARLTHHHPLAGEVSAVVVTLCRRLIRGVPWQNALAAAMSGRSEEIVKDVPLSPNGYAPDVLRAAIHFVGNSESFEIALTRSIEFAGSGSYCPVLVGSLSCLRYN